MHLKCGKYVLRYWDEKTDWCPKSFNRGSFTLEYESKPVGVSYGLINRIMRMETRPSDSGHGTRFIMMLIHKAKQLGATSFRVEGVLGDTPADLEKMEHILGKLGFKQMDEDIWVLNIGSQT